MSSEAEEVQCQCGHSSWYQEGEGEGARRCCRHCGFIAVGRDPSKPRPGVDLGEREAAELRRRAGVSEDVIAQLSGASDKNVELGLVKKEFHLFSGWAVAYAVLVLLFGRWILEPCETRRQVIGGIVFLTAVFIYLVSRVVRAKVRIAAIEGQIRTPEAKG
jgi:hypothetical protein